MILISGEITIETTLKVDGFPIHFSPVQFPFFGMHSSVAGVGVNQGAALTALGHPFRLLGMIGPDARGRQVTDFVREKGWDGTGILSLLAETTQSLILYEASGARMIYNDLKDIQEKSYPEKEFRRLAQGAQAAVLCNLSMNRAILPVAKELGLPIITDVHVLSDPGDAYNRDFLENADVLFLSNVYFQGHEKDFCEELTRRYPMKLLIVGMGEKGAMVWRRDVALWHHSEAPTLRPVINTVGAGDALSASFCHHWLMGLEPEKALDKACRFASWKVGTKGAAEGFHPDP